MIGTIYDTTTGRILRVVSCPENLLEAQVRAGEAMLSGQHLDDRTHYVNVATGSPVEKPAQPSPHHFWDHAVHTWQVDLELLRAGKAEAIERERVRRAALPVDLAGVSYDADATARENITGKLGEIREHMDQGLFMDPGSMFWRDADNAFHTFVDMTAYKQFLGSLLIAITSRGTALYGWKWQKGQELAGLSTFAELDAFDPAL